MDGDKVGLAKKYIQAGKGGAGLPFEIGPRVVCSIENLHSEPLRAPCNGLPDASGADNAEGFGGVFRAKFQEAEPDDRNEQEDEEVDSG